MVGGTIGKNESGNDGGGVYVYGGGSSSIAYAYIRNGTIGGASAADANKAQYGAGLYVGAYGRLELGTAGANQPYPYIRYNESSAGGTGGGIVINDDNPADVDDGKAIFYHGTVSNNDGATLGGGILIVNGTLDMQGGTVTANEAATGKGITVEKTGLLYMSKAARVLDANNPIHLHEPSPNKRWITIGTGEFSSPPAIGDIAIVTTNGYDPGDTILKQSAPGQVPTYYAKFKVWTGGSYQSLTIDGKIP
jgi:hypothetical protein